MTTKTDQPTEQADSSGSNDCSPAWLLPGENEILKFFRSTPKGIDDLPPYEQVAKVMGYMARRPFNGYVDVEVATDALAELQPDQRDFWHRVGATHKDNFNRTLAMMLSDSK